MRQRLIMMAKAPVSGQCKMGLCPPLEPAEAATLYSRFVGDLSRRLERWAAVDGRSAGIAYIPERAGQYFATRSGSRLTLERQVGEGFGQRLAHLLETATAAGYDKVGVMMSDSPSMPDAWLDDAFSGLDSADLVMGPCVDGGFYLLALTAYSPVLLRDVAWGSPIVTQQMVERATAAALRIALLPDWYDVDGPEDLERLVRETRSTAGRRLMPTTAQYIRHLERDGRLPG